MEKKEKNGLQIRFNSEFEQDVIEFFTELKKAEIHITAISAFRMYMKSVGFYEKRSFGDKDLINMTDTQQTGELATPQTIAIPRPAPIAFR